ncbi:MAG: alcohol dehydrogenase catalytic domain-containing protein [Kiritimatiellaeota bacterium]|nr:alcohol dehydrogenase catalytic domain-containing protein [Kiritimatiellota bacterium]
MKAIAVTGPESIELVELPRPVIREYECLVKVTACGLCNSTDLKMIDGHVGDALHYPFILGHEGVGEVVEVGSRVRNFKLGDLVTDPAFRTEGETGYRPDCGHFVEYAVAQDFEAMAEMGIEDKAFRAHCTRRVSLPLSPADAAILLTFKETYSALKNFGFTPGMDVLLFGDGPIGLALIRLMRLLGAGWLGCVGHWDNRLERIKTDGGADCVVNGKTHDVKALLGGRSFDMIVDAVGASSIIKQGFPMLKTGGKIAVFGVLKQSDPGVTIRDIRNNTSLHVLQWPVGEHEVHDEVVDMVRSGQLDPRRFYSHTETLANFAEAVRKIRTREAFKVVVVM